MEKRRLQTVFSLLLVSSLSACGSGGSTIPATNRTFDAPASVAHSVVSLKTTAVSDAGPSQYIAIDAGGSAASRSWIADTDYSLKSWSGTASVSNAIDTAGIPNAGPQAVYQTQRYGAHLAYTVPNLTPGASYNVRLSFVESWFSAAGKRIFGIRINGTQELGNFDIFQSAGGANVAIVRDFTTTASSTGMIAINLDASVNNASIAGIEVSSVVPAATPTPTPTPAPAPSPTLNPATSASPTPPARPTAHPGYGPRVPVGPQASITCAPNSVNLSPGQNVQSIVNAHAAGTSYCFSPGTYAQQSITPQSGDTYIGTVGAVLDGQNATAQAFSDDMSGGPVTNVTIKNLVIKNYASLNNTGTVDSSRRAASTGWRVVNNEIASSAAEGLRTGSGWNVVGNYIHNNQEGGYLGLGNGVTITDNEIAFNDPTDAYDMNCCGSGGGKAFQTSNFTVSYNYSHDNVGPGIWYDTDNTGSVITYNDSENNTRNGIMYEISWDGIIQHNYLANNGTSNTVYGCSNTTPYCGAIFISSSGGEAGTVVDISANTIIAGAYGAGLGEINNSRGSGLFGTYQVQNVHVHNNSINISAPGAIVGGMDQTGSFAAMFSTAGNSFDYDTYTGIGTSSSFYWGPGSNGVRDTFAGFQSSGQEVHGTSN